MADKGIIFSAPMVQALLGGRKSQTRRLLKPAPIPEAVSAKCVGTEKPSGRAEFNFYDRSGAPIYAIPSAHGFEGYYRAPYAPGDRLYVREAWTARMTHGWTIADARSRMYQEEILYRADGEQSIDGWWPSIHMPREFSRLWLAVTDVRVQRVQDISEADAGAEGVERHPAAPKHLWKSYEHDANPSPTTRLSFGGLWNSLHTRPGETWDDNPWIVAVTFDAHPGNIDGAAHG